MRLALEYAEEPVLIFHIKSDPVVGDIFHEIFPFINSIGVIKISIGEFF